MTQKPGALARFSRLQRRRAFRDLIRASYDVAGADPDFQAEMRQLNKDFDAALLDGLERVIEQQQT